MRYRQFANAKKAPPTAMVSPPYLTKVPKLEPELRCGAAASTSFCGAHPAATGGHGVSGVGDGRGAGVGCGVGRGDEGASERVIRAS